MLGIDDVVLIGVAYGIGKLIYYALKGVYEGKDGYGPRGLAM